MTLRFRMSRCFRLFRSLPAWGSRRWFQPFRWSLKFLIGQMPPPPRSNLKFQMNPPWPKFRSFRKRQPYPWFR